MLGITVGCLAGVMCWFFPNKNEVNPFAFSTFILLLNKINYTIAMSLTCIFTFFSSVFKNSRSTDHKVCLLYVAVCLVQFHSFNWVGILLIVLDLSSSHVKHFFYYD